MDESQHLNQEIPVEASSETASTESSAACPSCEQYLAGWRRAQADYQNLKKEVEVERIERAKYANEKLLRDLLPTLDQFALAMSFIPNVDGLPEADRKTWANWLTGVRAVESLWDQAATQAGLKRIATDGAFDPQLHDAVGQEASDKPEGEIVRVVQQGWLLHGKVLQPARVIVAQARV